MIIFLVEIEEICSDKIKVVAKQILWYVLRRNKLRAESPHQVNFISKDRHQEVIICTKVLAYCVEYTSVD